MSQSDAGGEGARIAPLCASFNQDCTSLAVGTISGYKLFSLTSVDRLEEIYKCTDTPDVYIVERLFSSSLVVIVSLSTPQKMNVYHFKKGTEICNYSYSNTILTVRLNRQRLVVCLEESIYIHNIKDLKLLKTIQDIPPNRTGLCALSINHSNSYLAYPGNATIGEIVIYDANNLGTVIRVFSIPEGEKLYEFRRGMKRYVNIGSLAFSGDSQFLSASSNTETIHIFKLEQPSQSRPQEESPTWSGYMGKMFMAATNYLPTQVSGIINQDRAFATVRLNFSGQRSICTLTVIQKLPRLLVAASDGFLYIYNLDPHDGGECVLIKKHRLHNEDDNNDTAKSDLTPSTSPTYAATVAKTSLVPSPSTAPGYSEDGGTLHGEIIPEHEFAAGPLHLDDETEFPPIYSSRGSHSEKKKKL
ncbi:WD repeat domain phosphoinositide-interacting protein 1 isoform X5 [Hemiscyllium ocellatum]|uniref:WD repeat domain phosphoinositide-interacting protein 1 isoform X5 n=1 Tax=Hemiscyllium ocellatum TaxID=170820 RepID=UPI002966AA01|nr:WD repeat domain phosphoinositide-interacting protein 1 isoform X5 [Hemiscyllium ocellatum]